MQNRHAADAFWGELPPCDHCVQIYEDDEALLEALEGFAAAGLRQGEGVVLIATPEHLAALAQRLALGGFDTAAAAAGGQYLALDARTTMAAFMVDGWPDEQRFRQTVMGVLQRMRRTHPQLRAFGEMVALMWAEGNEGAAVHLEHLWTRLCQQEAFPLFCAYPRAGFARHPPRALVEVCAAHSRRYTA